MYYELGKWSDNQRKIGALYVEVRVKRISRIKETQNRNLNLAPINLHQSPQESTHLPREWGRKTPRVKETFCYIFHLQNKVYFEVSLEANCISNT